MPEGDTIHGAADRLADAIAGAEITAASGTHRAMIEFGRRIVGATVDEVTAHGKHLLIHFSNGWTLRTHMRMTGSWHIYEPGQAWRITPGKARVVLETDERIAVCFAAPTVQLAPWHIVAPQIDELGPDLMNDGDFTELAGRVKRMRPGSSICDAIIDQEVISGLGNVYKSELLYLAGVHPDRAVGDIADDVLAATLRRGHRLLLANRGQLRTTTGSRRPGRHTWVYGRAGRDCRRCGTTIEYGTRGPLARHTYWCPHCQPAVDPAA